MADQRPSGSAPPLQEFTVRVPALPEQRQYAVLKFNENLHIDVKQWRELSLNREDNSAILGSSSSHPVSGAGSVFGQDARDLARRKKYGHRINRYSEHDQPWILTDHGKQGKRYRGIREGRFGEGSSYWIFVKAADGVFDAFPVSEWYSFVPVARYKTLDIDEAEEQFLKRNKILNQFAVMKATDEDGGEKTAKSRGSLKLREGFEENDKQDDDDEGEKVADADEELKKPKKGGAKKKPKDNAEDEIAAVESDDGDEEGLEVDYMSDSEPSESEPEPEESKMEKALVGVAEEEGLRDMLSGDEDEDEEDEAKNGAEDGAAPQEEEQADKGAKENDSSGESSDSDDPDKEVIKSALFLPAKKGAEGAANGQGTSKSGKGDGEEKKGSEKRKATPTGEQDAPPSKKTKKEPKSGISEEEVKKYLQRKPHSTKELVSKFKNKCGSMDRNELIQRLVDILKRLEPERTKRNDTMYFFINSEK